VTNAARRALSFLLLSAAAAGCSDRKAEVAGPSASASAPSTVAFALSGTVFDHSSGTPEPRAGVALQVNMPGAVILFISDRTGRYRVTNVPRSAVWVAPSADSEYRAPCPGGAALLDGDMLVDVHVVSASELAANGMPSTLPRTGVWFAGTIFETTAGRRQPVAGATVELDAGVATLTDFLGRYAICTVPPGTGGGASATLSVGKNGYVPSTRQVVGALGQGGIDVELIRR